MAQIDNTTLDQFGVQLSAFYHAINGNFSDADHMKNDVPVEEAIRYLQRHHGTIQDNMLKASQALRKMRQLAGIPGEY